MIDRDTWAKNMFLVSERIEVSLSGYRCRRQVPESTESIEADTLDLALLKYLNMKGIYSDFERIPNEDKGIQRVPKDADYDVFCCLFQQFYYYKLTKADSD